MKSIIRIVLLLIGVLSIGCYEDKGNYDLVDYNKIEEVVLIPSLSNTAVYLGDTVRINIPIGIRLPDLNTCGKRIGKAIRWERQGCWNMYRERQSRTRSIYMLGK